ncbi:MAG: ribosome small subunit-dependent GTPase A [Christensenellales bacterium]|jgi:ribosome biogenesis GTPase
MKGLVLKGIGGFYTVMDERGATYVLRAQNKIRRQNLSPTVGDYVEFTPGQGEEEGWLEEILPRKNALVRPTVANVDAVCYVLASSTPAPDTLLVDRLLLTCRMNGIQAYVAINKCDLDPETALDLEKQYETACEGVFRVCAIQREGIEPLKKALFGKKHAFGGQSGVGKSTLINALYGLSLETGEVSERIERGRHTTRRSELIPVEGGMVFDTPGFSLMELPLMEPEMLPRLYPEFIPYEGQCRFSPCSHTAEPNCAVKRAIAENGIMHEQRYDRYLRIFEEVTNAWRDRYD